MEETPHVMLVGDGARSFAREQGLEETELLTEERREAWQQWRQKQHEESEAYDTIAMIALDADGNIAGGCSTSGWDYKLPRRVGDSPIIGGGLYVDNDGGSQQLSIRALLWGARAWI